MQIYILNRAKQTLATTASIYDDTHTMSLTAGSSSYEFTIDKADDASTSLETGNYVVLQDDNKKTWLFTILEATEDQNTKTVYAEDAGIELINKAVDVWSFNEAHDFKYYFDLITKDTPWTLGTNQLSGLSRTLKFEGRDTGLGRLLSVLKAFDNAECRFNVEFSLTEPVKFTVDVAKAIGNVRDDMQIVYNAELNNITKTESRAEFVTALCGVGGTLESEDGQQTTTVDFADLEYNQNGLYTSKGDKFLYAVDANKKFNPGDSGYIENFYEYDTQSASELLNRTITKLKTYSEPQLTYEADVKIIDGSLKIGDKVTIIDHDFNPAVYLTARVSTLVKSYTDSTKNTITFTNYELINSNVVLQNKVETIKNQITKLPTQETVNDLKDKVINVSQQVDDAVSGIEDAKQNAQSAVDKAEQAIADAGLATDKADKVNEIAQSAQENAQNAISNAQSAIANAQNAISNAQKAQETANNAISNAQNAINQASSAGTIANAVKQDVINLKGGSTATIAELQNGLALKLERKDLNGYATESWTTTQISASADGLSAEIGKVSGNLNTQYTNLKASVDSVTTTVGEVEGDVTNLTGRIQSAETSINQTKSDIALKANKTDVDNLTKRVSSAESSIKINSDSIALKANKTDVDNLTNRVSSAETSIKQNADSINLTASKVDSLQIGGRNLILNSNQINILGSDFSSMIKRETGKITVLQAGVWNAYRIFTDEQLSEPISEIINDSNRDWTLSVDVKVANLDKSSTVRLTFQAWLKQANIWQNVTSTLDMNSNDKWQNISMPMTAKESNITKFALLFSGTTNKGAIIEYKNLKLERGNKATDWTPAPEDTDSKIGDLDTKYSNLNVTVNGIQSTVANKADKSTVTQLANTWQAKLDNVNKTTTASITAVRNDLTASINLKVSKNDVVNQINVDTSGILIQGKKVHITGQTVIDNAVIKSAMIDTITADKIKTGTLDGIKITSTGKDPSGTSSTTTIQSGYIDTNVINCNDHILVGKADPDPRKRWQTKQDSFGMWFTCPAKKNGHTGNTVSDWQTEMQGFIGSDGWNYKNVTASGTGQSGIQLALTPQQEWGSPYGGDQWSIGTWRRTGASNASGDIRDGTLDPVMWYSYTGQGAAYANQLVIQKPTQFFGKANFQDGVRIGVTGANHGIRTAWVSWSDWGSNQKVPCIVQDATNWGGIAFPANGRAVLFTHDYRVDTDKLPRDGGNYNGYGG